MVKDYVETKITSCLKSATEEQHKLSTYEVAKRTGLSWSTVDRWSWKLSADPSKHITLSEERDKAGRLTRYLIYNN